MTNSKKTELTERQAEVLSGISKLIRTSTISPSHEDIANHCGIDKSTVEYFVRTLIRKGHLRKDGRKYRSLQVVRGKAA